MKVLLTGATGQAGRELLATAPQGVKAVALSSRELDVRDQGAVMRKVAGESPEVIINCAAYTAVDRAEEDQEAAFAVNGDGPRHLALAAQSVDAFLVHLSTDFVFDGRQGSPYLPDAPPNPVNVYGQSKLAGEEAVQEAGCRAAIVRTAWLYSRHRSNFVLTMLKLFTEKDELRVVADQVGSPTWARSLARALWRLVELEHPGVYHWTDSGVASWYDLAMAVYEEARLAGLVQREVAIHPVATADYPTSARRPPYSVLDKKESVRILGVEPLHWRVTLRQMLAEMRGLNG